MVIDYGMKVYKITKEQIQATSSNSKKFMEKYLQASARGNWLLNCFYFNGARACSKTVSPFGWVLKTKPILYDFVGSFNPISILTTPLKHQTLLHPKKGLKTVDTPNPTSQSTFEGTFGNLPSATMRGGIEWNDGLELQTTS